MICDGTSFCDSCTCASPVYATGVRASARAITHNMCKKHFDNIRRVWGNNNPPRYGWWVCTNLDEILTNEVKERL